MSDQLSAHMNAAYHMERAVARLELAFRYLVEARMLDQSGDIDLCIGTIRPAMHTLSGGEGKSCETCRYSVDGDCTAGDGECWPPKLALWRAKQDEGEVNGAL